ncbi:MAG: SHOCT domain-containing protein [Christensenellales bacterium]
MRKGRGLLTTAGVLNIIFGLGLIAIVAMFFLYSEPFEILIGTFISILNLILQDPIASLVYGSYGAIVIYAILGIFSFIIGIVTVVKSKKEAGEYYKKIGSFIYFTISEALILAFFVFNFVVYFTNTATIDIPLICLTGLAFIIFVLLFLGTIRLGIGKKQALKPTVDVKTIPQLNEYNDESVDLITKIKRLNALKDSGEITQKQYLDAKAKLLGE